MKKLIYQLIAIVCGVVFIALNANATLFKCPPSVSLTQPLWGEASLQTDQYSPFQNFMNPGVNIPYAMNFSFLSAATSGYSPPNINKQKMFYCNYTNNQYLLTLQSPVDAYFACTKVGAWMVTVCKATNSEDCMVSTVAPAAGADQSSECPSF